MKKNLYLLSEILELNSSDIKAIIDSGVSIHELIFSDGDYLQESLKLDKSLISRISALKELVSDLSFNELQKRRRIKGVEDAVKYLKIKLSPLAEEHLVVLFLNKGNDIVDQLEIRGSLDEVQLDYRLVTKKALVSEAAGIICAHNHPSGSVNPSTEDRHVTAELKKNIETSAC